MTFFTHAFQFPYMMGVTETVNNFFETVIGLPKVVAKNPTVKFDKPRLEHSFYASKSAQEVKDEGRSARQVGPILHSRDVHRRFIAVNDRGI